MIIVENISLAQYTTFKIGGKARFFCIVSNIEELKEAVIFTKDKNIPLFILGGGSNILISDEGFKGLVIKMELRGIEIIEDIHDVNKKSVLTAAGEIWDDFVKYTVDNGLYGLENLSLIPGTVGASPIQNIGAYGAEVKDVIQWVEVLEIATGNISKLSNAECRFSYRNSVFKELSNKFVVTRVAFRLNKDGEVDTDYKDVREYFEKKGITSKPTIDQVRQAIVDIRTAKLPDLEKWGTAGSFFKNPVITVEHFNELKIKYPELPSFPEPDGKVKVPLGYIIDKICGMRGYVNGKVASYDKQALVIVAGWGASAKEVKDLAMELTAKIKEKTGIEVNNEVEFI